MTSAATLFEHPARPTDPSTSHDAARPTPARISLTAEVRDILAKHPEGLTDDKLWRLTGLGMHRHGSVVRARQRAGAVASGRFGVSESQARCIIWVLPEAQS